MTVKGTSENDTEMAVMMKSRRLEKSNHKLPREVTNDVGNQERCSRDRRGTQLASLFGDVSILQEVKRCTVYCFGSDRQSIEYLVKDGNDQLVNENEQCVAHDIAHPA